VMPIVDVRGLLGLPDSRPGRCVQTLVVRDGGLQAAVVVDTVFGLEPFDDVVPVDDPGTARLRAPRPLMAGWIRCSGETLALLDVPKMLAALRPAMAASAHEVSA
ncbi:MAG TPA: chemotaxis protein CheW, partial [Methylomirabilota bacterium]|nr:chemotaxis protein CheW [Methylomirabilota bacterium]